MENQQPEINSLPNEPQLNPFVGDPNDPSRLGLPFPSRLLMGAGAAFIGGLSFGIPHGSARAAYRFRAENAHRMPTSTTGWYLYHKSKNYHAMLGGVKEGFKFGMRLAPWAAGFFIVEEVVDNGRGGNRDVLSTVIAGLTNAGGYSLWNKLPVSAAALTAKKALVLSIAFGFAQDGIATLKGYAPSYLNFLAQSRQNELDSVSPEMKH
ncbi:MAG: hypothetical protein M1834_007716 [Cirrosporium novae-zelandiae]|nr:MAG: hypothetical protein M1834_007716 [Cirrosporium novae-zelandiae]